MPCHAQAPAREKARCLDLLPMSLDLLSLDLLSMGHDPLLRVRTASMHDPHASGGWPAHATARGPERASALTADEKRPAANDDSLRRATKAPVRTAQEPSQSPRSMSILPCPALRCVALRRAAPPPSARPHPRNSTAFHWSPPGAPVRTKQGARLPAPFSAHVAPQHQTTHLRSATSASRRLAIAPRPPNRPPWGTGRDRQAVDSSISDPGRHGTPLPPLSPSSLLATAGAGAPDAVAYVRYSALGLALIFQSQSVDLCAPPDTPPAHLLFTPRQLPEAILSRAGAVLDIVHAWYRWDIMYSTYIGPCTSTLSLGRVRFASAPAAGFSRLCGRCNGRIEIPSRAGTLFRRLTRLQTEFSTLSTHPALVWGQTRHQPLPLHPSPLALSSPPLPCHGYCRSIGAQAKGRHPWMAQAPGLGTAPLGSRAASSSRGARWKGGGVRGGILQLGLCHAVARLLATDRPQAGTRGVTSDGAKCGPFRSRFAQRINTHPWVNGYWRRTSGSKC
ncbi:hypothetical protein CDD83_11002 [Cordyceps sp. RAO-2017]|nr:hypothetical protein CDD83_11002 [Cordyceps sp. RAO-2017]